LPSSSSGEAVAERKPDVGDGFLVATLLMKATRC
jgi:hypothetical protein